MTSSGGHRDHPPHRGPHASFRRHVGIGHLTMLDVSPPDLVSAASSAGFDFVGIRVATAGLSEDRWPLSATSPMLAETLLRLDDTGLYVNEVEVLPIRPATTVAGTEPVMATAATLGARHIIAFVEDDDLDRAGDTLAALSARASTYSLRILLEPMSYQAVRSFAQAKLLLDAAPEAGIVVDPLQMARCGDTLDDVRALDQTTVPFLQICDGPLHPPDTLPRTGLLPRGQSSGTLVTQLEARAWRLPPGEGELPLAELVSIWPSAPISLESPNLGLSRLLDPVSLARRHRAGVERVLTAMASERDAV
jgi:sugar phosphate isomerase/epimerase